MDLRVTLQTLVNLALTNTRLQTSRLGKLHEQAVTGKRIQVPSDDPISVGPLLANKAQDDRLDTYLATLRDARTILDTSVGTLTDAGNVLVRARTLALEGAQSTNDQDGRNALAQEIDRLLERMIDLANTQNAGSYIYAGTATQTKPFVANGPGAPSQVVYQGVSERGVIRVGPQQNIHTYYSGAEIFQQRQRAPTVYTGNTGAAAGTGTDNGIGNDTLLVAHTTTTYQAGSGVQAGTGSAAGDTVIGPPGAHQLTIVDTSGTGAFGTVALNGGPAIAFTSADTNLRVTGASGEVVFIDTTAITANFNGAVNITANGTLSTDGGATSALINFSANQVVTDSVTGAVTNVNSVNIRRAGSALLDYRGTYDVFQALMALRDDLRNTRGLSEPDQLQSISQRIEELDRVRTGVLEFVGLQSADLQNLENLEFSLKDVQLTTRKLISNLEDADLSQIVLQLQAQQNLFQLTLGSSARLFDQNILDFLR